MARRPLRLSTPREVRAAITKVINEIRGGELTPQQGNAIIAGCNAALSSIRIDEQEKRLNELESILEEQQRKADSV